MLASLSVPLTYPERAGVMAWSPKFSWACAACLPVAQPPEHFDVATRQQDPGRPRRRGTELAVEVCHLGRRESQHRILHISVCDPTL